MKTIRLSLAAVALAVAALPAFAAENTGPSADSPRVKARMRALRHVRAGEQARVAERLGLTAEQQDQLKAKRANTAAAAKAIRGDASLTPEQKHAKLRETWQNSAADMRSVLTPEQQTKLQQMKRRAHRMAHRRSSL